MIYYMQLILLVAARLTFSFTTNVKYDLKVKLCPLMRYIPFRFYIWLSAILCEIDIHQTIYSLCPHVLALSSGRLNSRLLLSESYYYSDWLLVFGLPQMTLHKNSWKFACTTRHPVSSFIQKSLSQMTNPSIVWP